MATIFIVEDDPKISRLLQSHMQRFGYHVVIAEEFHNIKQLFCEVKPDLVLMDVNLPQFDGFYWCRQIRSISTCPMLFISAREGTMDQVMALDSGADDYVTKPFDYEVVVAKVRSHLRRAYGSYAPGQRERVLQIGDVVLYPERLFVMVGKQKMDLSKKEMMLLEMLFACPARVVNREQLLEKLWDDEKFVDENTLNVYVTRVRKKLRDFGVGDCIETVRGVGYRLTLTSADKPEGP